eukprot:GGOE01018347.1.p1 GENE.GGOE01018347.1~~GGOE01018347.1.p1  ORF type:complete len:706 (-),score=118.82 GGOE01018347.1:246-2117(-)
MDTGAPVDRPHSRPKHVNPGGLLCYNCWSRLHMVDHCPHPLFCSKCGGDNHTAQVCEVTKRGQEPIGSCYNCGATDHSVKKCPHSLFCTFCERPGHTRNVCWREDPARKSQHTSRREKQQAAASNPVETGAGEVPPEVDILSILRSKKGPKKQQNADDFMDLLRRCCEQLDSVGFPVPAAEHPQAMGDEDVSIPGEDAPLAPGERHTRCYNCRSSDHVARNCPKKLFCTRCQKEGHTANRCKTCHNCGGYHLLSQCPKPIVCTGCHQAGHTVNKCKKRLWKGATVTGFDATATAGAMLQALQQTGALAAKMEVIPVPGHTPLCVVLSPSADERDAFVTALNEHLPLVANIADAEEIAALLGPAQPPSTSPQPAAPDAEQEGGDIAEAALETAPTLDTSPTRSTLPSSREASFDANTPITCTRCRQEGHTANECKKRAAEEVATPHAKRAKASDCQEAAVKGSDVTAMVGVMPQAPQQTGSLAASTEAISVVTDRCHQEDHMANECKKRAAEEDAQPAAKRAKALDFYGAMGALDASTETISLPGCSPAALLSSAKPPSTSPHPTAFDAEQERGSIMDDTFDTTSTRSILPDPFHGGGHVDGGGAGGGGTVDAPPDDTLDAPYW